MEQRLIPTAMHQTGDEERIGFRLHPLAMTDAIEPHQDAIPAKVKSKTRSRAQLNDASGTSAIGWCGTGRRVRHALGAARFPCHPGGVARNRRRRGLVSGRPKNQRTLRGWHVSSAVGFMNLATRRLTRRSPCARAAEPPAGAFGYLLREPLHVWRRRWIRGTACIVLIGAIACAFSIW